MLKRRIAEEIHVVIKSDLPGTFNVENLAIELEDFKKDDRRWIDGTTISRCCGGWVSGLVATQERRSQSLHLGPEPHARARSGCCRTSS